MLSTLTHHTRRIGLTMAVSALLLSGGCATDSVTDPGATLSDEARADAMAKTSQVLQTERSLDAANLIQDLTGGVTVGLADEAAGLDMELGSEIPQFASSRGYSIGSRIVRAKQTADRPELLVAQAGKLDAEPGDVLYEETITNPDGSVTTLRVIQDSPQSVVKVEVTTDWPNGHLLLDETRDEAVVDRGPDLEDASDDVLLSLSSELSFNNGARLARTVDERANGGIVDDARVTVVSVFTARPHHPLLVDISTDFVLDVHQLDNDADDRFVSAARLSRFVGIAHVGGQPRVEESLTPESPVAEGEEPCGGQARRYIAFNQRNQLRDWTDSISFSCAGEGNLSRTIRWAEGGTDAVSISKDLQGIITLNASDHLGNSTTATFDEANGNISAEITFAPGRDPVRKSFSGHSNAEGTEWSLDGQVEYADGFVETSHLEGREDAEGKRLAGNTTNREETVEFELSANADETQYAGSISNDRGESFEFEIEILPDMGKIVDFLAVNPQTRVEGHLEVGADGCGTGTIIVEENGNRATIEVQFCNDELSSDAGDLINL